MSRPWQTYLNSKSVTKKRPESNIQIIVGNITDHQKNAAVVTPPLVNFLKGHTGKQNSEISWTPQALQSFQQCKIDLKDAVMLAYPRSDVPWSIMVDASEEALGGSVQQLVEGKWQPLGFFSRKLTTAERYYSAYDRELLSAFASVKYFKH